MTIDARINEFFEPVATKMAEVVFYSVPVMGGHEVKLILVWMVAASLFFTLYLGFVNVRFFRHAIEIVQGKHDPKKGRKPDGEINRFQALMTSLSGTVGLGNIAGVAVAISVGGPGAAFWMFVMGFFGMSTKFAEVMMGVKYRQHADPDSPKKIAGGPMYYIAAAFKKRGRESLGRLMGGFFALCLVVGCLGGASLFQTNQAYQQVMNVTGGESSFLAGQAWMFGVFMAFIVALVIVGGIRSIAAAASRIVPFMGGLYLAAGLVIVGMNFEQIPTAFQTIIDGAFGVKAGLGGLIGALLMGVQRATFSNEAGLGTAAIAHASVQTKEPVSQGFVGMLGPFIDTMVICMTTALVIVVTGVYDSGNGMEGVELTSRAFESGLSWFPYVLALTVFLFAYTSIISWSYYGARCFGYLFGEHEHTINIFKLVFLAFIIVGASAELEYAILFTDAGVFAMTVPNIIGLYLLAPEIKKDVKAYLKKKKLA